MGTWLFAFSMMFFLGMAAGIPLGWVFLGATFVGATFAGISFGFMSGAFFDIMMSPLLPAVGFFVLAGSLLEKAGLASRIVGFSHLLVGKMKGGLINVVILACLIMGALTGGSLPALSALIPLLVGEMEKYGYKKAYTTSVICSSSYLGYLIPPSNPALFYCLIAQQSVAAVFLSTVVPGIMLAGGYAVLNRFLVDKYRTENHGLDESLANLTDQDNTSYLSVATKALPALGCPVIILGGIYGGIFTPGEAGAVAVFYTLAVGFWIYKELSRREVWDSLSVSVRAMGITSIMLGGGAVMGRFLMRMGVADHIADFLVGSFNSEILVLAAMNVFLLLLGMFIDGMPIMIMAVPILIPIAQQFGVNLIHLGAIVILNTGIGIVTPPFAMSIFVGSKLSGVPAGQLIPPMVMFLIFVAIPVLLMTTYIPVLSLWLPTKIVGPLIVGAW